MNDITRTTEREQVQVATRENERNTQSLTRTPAVDVEETSQGITMWLDIPGVDRDKLEIEVHDNTLRIQGEASVPTPQKLELRYAEIRESRYVRNFTLGSDLDTANIEAQLQDGVLKLTIPRREEARPRRIEVLAA
ncbi:Hsp20/alpha crystallin family protein [Parapusillimonas sp. SGNA-6]|nr:Hsp20/alpha crystallin family protein [Parapusillimonas sp. SGNA-6]